MALLVLVKFENDEKALEWVEHAEENMPGELSVPAIYKAPTMFHGAYETHGAKKTQSAWTMGQKWGWWVCAVCKKPSELYWSQIMKQSSFGKNIKSMFFSEESPD